VRRVDLRLGLDVGSTTVKAVVADSTAERTLWKRCERHETRPLERVLALLQRIQREFPDVPSNCIRVAVTGSGGHLLVDLLGARFVQEVAALCGTVERRFPDAGSVVELGGQDAKIVILQKDPKTGQVRRIPSMNDKCAGGTGAVLDKIAAKLGIPADRLAAQGYDGLELHPVAGKCGVFAETDINSLQMQGVPPDQLMASLFEAIVTQNLSVLTRGHALRPRVLLLGGPNTHIRGLQEAWRAHIPRMWKERGIEVPATADPDDLITVPEDAQYFPALGALESSPDEDEDADVYLGTARLEAFLGERRVAGRRGASDGLVKSEDELATFRREYRPKTFTPPDFRPGEEVGVFVGLDGGSTSTKGVLIDARGDLLAKAYRLSGGNPIEDAREILTRLRTDVESRGARVSVRGLGVTGYAKEVLQAVLGADVALVETVAHAASAVRTYRDVDVICDVGGQDIKIMMLQDGHVKDFKLNTQCSAGNGYFLQRVAEQFGIPVHEFAETAFRAKRMPTFSYGCAVFLQSDIVNFQRQGWSPEEILAGLAAILPKNIWLYVARIPNFASLGRTFVLQGGTQRNLAAVKAQVDFIRARMRGRGTEPRILVHEHCGEAGAIGAALEARRTRQNGRPSDFIGFDALTSLTWSATTDESTICPFCRNRCQRTFLEFEISGAEPSRRRLITGNACEKGSVDDVDEVRAIKADLDRVLADTENLAEITAREAFQSFAPASVRSRPGGLRVIGSGRKRAVRSARRDSLRIGIPRVLNVYSAAPFVTAWLESLGVRFRNIVFSDFSSEGLYRQGCTRASIDPCFPSKLGVPHVHNLIYRKHERNPLDAILFPMFDDLPSDVTGTMACRVCPTITATPTAVRAAFRKDGDLFARKGIEFLCPFLNLAQPALLERQLRDQLGSFLGLTRAENSAAVRAGYAALEQHRNRIRERGLATIRRLERERRLGIVVLGRPYHADPGVNHGIFRDLQRRGYPILTAESLPADPEFLDELFGDEIREGLLSDPLDISDVWKTSFNSVSNRKLWAAKVVARHPNLVGLEVSSFRCGHDAPIFGVVQEIVEKSGTPFFAFRDLDENRSAGSIRIRIETIDYFLRRHREALVDRCDRARTVHSKA